MATAKIAPTSGTRGTAGRAVRASGAPAADEIAHDPVEELVDFFFVVTAPPGGAELGVPDLVDQLADGRRNVRVRSGPLDQLREFTNQAVDVPRGVPAAQLGQGEGDGTDIRRRGWHAVAQLRPDIIEEGVHVGDAVPGRVPCQPVLRGLEQADRATVRIHEAIIYPGPAGRPPY
jgi:hypothetical protein